MKLPLKMFLIALITLLRCIVNVLIMIPYHHDASAVLHDVPAQGGELVFTDYDMQWCGIRIDVLWWEEEAGWYVQ